MSDVIVHFSIDRMDAEVAASALRAEQLHPRIAPDITSSRLGAAGVTTAGRWLVYVPAHEEGHAREILDEPAETEELEDNPILRMAIIVALIVGLLLATPFVAQVCYGPR
jgi:hypothetical protein